MVTGVLGNVLVLSPLVIVAQGRLTHRLLVALTDDIVNSQMGFQLYYADMGTFVFLGRDIRICSCGEYEGVSGEDMYGTTGEVVKVSIHVHTKPASITASVFVACTV